jgi:hypothetical protein
MMRPSPQPRGIQTHTKLMIDETSEMHTGSNSTVHYDRAVHGIRKKRGFESLLPEEIPEVEVDVFKD